MKDFKTVRWTILIIILIICQPGCAKLDKTGKTSAADTPQSITVAAVLMQKIERRVDITGTLAPWEDANISFEVDGRIMEVLVDLGQAGRGACHCWTGRICMEESTGRC